MTFRDLSPRARWVLVAIWAVGTWALVWSAAFPVVERGPRLTWALLAFVVFASVAELFPVTLEGGHYELTVSTIFLVAAVVVFRDDPELAVLVALISSLVGNLVARKAWFKVCTNVALTVIAVSLGSMAFNLVGFEDTAHLVGASVALLVTYFAAITVPVSLLLSAVEGRPFQLTYVNNYRQVAIEQLGIQMFGLVFAALWTMSPWLSPVFILPSIVLYQAYLQLERLRAEGLSVLEGMADLIENRDRFTDSHTNTVSNYARRLAERLRLSANEVMDVTIAGRLHDLGKVVVSDAVVLKPGALTQEEKEMMREHCRVGFEVLSRFSSLRSVARLIRAHHEHYDGSGYPDQLSGKEIPMGASIISVVDAFDAMTSTRSYRKAIPVDEALNILRKGLGKQWDPIAGATFIQMILEDQAKAQQTLAA
jgi:HD-GYP domain-containing protein (c-di-GMP phosphodiesterase class II)